MNQQTLQTDPFKEQLRESLQRETHTCGDQDEMVYFIESGKVKLLMLSPEGKECLLAIHSAGDVFGELCLSGSSARLETATTSGGNLIWDLYY